MACSLSKGVNKHGKSCPIQSSLSAVYWTRLFIVVGELISHDLISDHVSLHDGILVIRGHVSSFPRLHQSSPFFQYEEMRYEVVHIYPSVVYHIVSSGISGMFAPSIHKQVMLFYHARKLLTKQLEKCLQKWYMADILYSPFSLG